MVGKLHKGDVKNGILLSRLSLKFIKEKYERKISACGEHLVCVHHGRMSFKYKQRSPKQSFHWGTLLPMKDEPSGAGKGNSV